MRLELVLLTLLLTELSLLVLLFIFFTLPGFASSPFFLFPPNFLDPDLVGGEGETFTEEGESGRREGLEGDFEEVVRVECWEED